MNIRYIDPVAKVVFWEEQYLKVLDNLPELIQIQLKNNPDILVAGGFIRDWLIGDTVSDIDVFCHTKEQAAKLAQAEGPYGILETSCSFTRMIGEFKVQYIYCREFTTPESLLKEFDFTCCCVALNYSIADVEPDWKITLVDSFEEDVLNKELKFRCADYNKGNLGALTRAFSFVQRGWFLSQKEMAKIIHHYTAFNIRRNRIPSERPITMVVPSSFADVPWDSQENNGWVESVTQNINSPTLAQTERALRPAYRRR